MPEILYRKWRPQTFAELYGQEHVATTLTNAMATGRVAHAYLFAGPRGTGKTSTGRLLAKALNCRDRRQGEPCNRCESCRDFLSGRALDLIELDAASNRGIDEIRSLRDKVAFASAGDFKVYLIDEVHMLTDAAFNALLKTLEEPPPHVVFVLATTEAHKVPPTIGSRCQRFDFRRASLVSLVANLERIAAGEGFDVEPAALELIARSATGSHRDAVNLLDQLVTSYGPALSVEHVKTGLGLIGDERVGRLARLVIEGDLAGGLELIGSVRDDGLDLRQFQRELVDELRTLLLLKTGVEPGEGLTAERRQELLAIVGPATTSALLTALKAFGEADLKQDPNSTLPLDIALAECLLGADGQSGNRAIGQSGAQTVRPDGQADAQTGRRADAQTEPPMPRRVTTPAPPPAAAAARPAPSPPRPTQPRVAETPQGTEPPSVSHAEPVEAAAEGAAVEPAALAAIASAPAASLSAAPGDSPAPAGTMRQIYDAAVRMKERPLAALLGVANIIELDDATILFGFRHPNHAEKASEKANRELLEGIVAEVFQRPLSVRCRHEPAIEDWMQVERATQNPLVRAAQAMGARILSSEPEE